MTVIAESRLMSDVSLAGAADLAAKGANDVEGIYTDPRFYAEMALKLLAHIAAQATELQQLRAEKAADRERVVSEVVHQFYLAMRTVQHGMTGAEKSVAAADVATRVADALAVPGRVGLSDQELSQLRELRSECVVDDYPAAGPALDRILSARPIPPLVRELVQREYDRVPAGEQYDWERTRLAECLEALP